MRRTTWPLAAVAAGALACSSSKSSQAPCNSVDKQCQDGQVCFEDGCGDALVFAVRVSPNSPSYVVQDFNPVSVATSVVDLTLGDSGDLSGTLAIMRFRASSDYVADPQKAATAVTILARGRSSSIPGLAFSDPAGAFVTSGDAFSAVVPPGIWTVSATPVDPAMPAAIAVARVAERGSASAQSAKPVVVTLPGEPGADLQNPDLEEISGVLQRTAAHPFPDGAAPLYRLQALDSSGAALSQQISARAGQTFTVWAQNASGQVTLRATPDPTETAPLPSRDFTSNADGQFAAAGGVFELGDFGDAVTVQGRVQDSAGNGLPDVRLQLTGVVAGDHSTFTTVASTGADPAGQGASALGAFQATLLPPQSGMGGYKATAIPPMDSTFATLKAVSVDVGAAAGVVIVCPEKALLSGTVTNSTGIAAAGIALFIEGNPASSSPGTTIVPGLSTDSSGSFAARVEPGGYRVVAMPSLGSKMAWASQRVEVAGAATVSLSLPDARQVSGTITVRESGALTPLPNASVEFYRSDSTATSASSYPIKLWETITDSKGQFQVNLPKSGTANQ